MVQLQSPFYFVTLMRSQMTRVGHLGAGIADGLSLTATSPPASYFVTLMLWKMTTVGHFPGKNSNASRLWLCKAQIWSRPIGDETEARLFHVVVKTKGINHTTDSHWLFTLLRLQALARGKNGEYFCCDIPCICNKHFTHWPIIFRLEEQVDYCEPG